jgi:hypothetical protein
MRTPSTDRVIAFLQSLGLRSATRFAALAAGPKTHAIDDLLGAIEQFTFGPDQSKQGQAAAQRVGEPAWQHLWRILRQHRVAVRAERLAAMHASKQE